MLLSSVETTLRGAGGQQQPLSCKKVNISISSKEINLPFTETLLLQGVSSEEPSK